MKIKSGKQAKPRRILLYGIHGIGKSTWAAKAPRPIFLDLEDGLNDIACDKSERIEAFGGVIDSISWLVQNRHDYQTVVIDTVDWLESLIWKAVCQRNGNAPSIEKVGGGYGKGYIFALDEWNFLIRGLEALRTRRGMHAILLAHCQVEKFNDPETDTYDRYAPNLNKHASALLQEWADEVLFASRKKFIRKQDVGFNKERTIAVGTDERYLQTQETAGVHAKNRLGLPVELPFTWDAYAAYLPKLGAPEVSKPEPTGGDIAGLVVDGSSKVAG
jgi:hypothetical protein